MKENRKTRELKVYGQSGYKYQNTPTIVLKGKWLENAGFKIGDQLMITIASNDIRITKANK